MTVRSNDNENWAFPTRVTGLGEFSPNELLFWADSLKITELSVIVDNFFPQQKFCINFDQKWVGHHVGRIFH
jgi:hypothetical protein